MADSTVEYYNRNAKRFLEETTQVNFSETQNEFLKLLHKEALIATGVVLFVFILIINLSFSALKGKN